MKHVVRGAPWIYSPSSFDDPPGKCYESKSCFFVDLLFIIVISYGIRCQKRRLDHFPANRSESWTTWLINGIHFGLLTCTRKVMELPTVTLFSCFSDFFQRTYLFSYIPSSIERHQILVTGDYSGIAKKNPVVASKVDSNLMRSFHQRPSFPGFAFEGHPPPRT